MNQVTAEQLLISPEEYLEGEPYAEVRHEYIDGEVYAMAGAGDAHVKVAGNAFVLLKTHLKGSGCSTYISDMKVRIGDDIAENKAFFYPDVMVCCDPFDQQPEQNYVKQLPKLIIEVLSPSTEANDRGRKFLLYRGIPSLEEYILVNPEEYLLERYSRQADNQWLITTYKEADAMVEFDSINFSCTLADFYDDVVFEKQDSADSNPLPENT